MFNLLETNLGDNELREKRRILLTGTCLISRYPEILKDFLKKFNSPAHKHICLETYHMDQVGYKLTFTGWNENVVYFDSNDSQIDPLNPPYIDGDHIITAEGVDGTGEETIKWFEFKIILANDTDVASISPRVGQKILGYGKPDKLFVPAGKTLTIGSNVTFTVAGHLILEPENDSNPGGKLIV